LNAKKKVAVIGSGFGGLALAVRLQSAGIATTLFEARDKPGGRAYVYHQDGFTFDAGPTVITDPTALQELFALSGRRMEEYVTLMPVEPFYRLYWEDGYELDYCSDEESLLRQIAKKSPSDVEGYKKFYEFCNEAFHHGYEKLGTVPFLNFWSMVRVAPQLVRLQAFRSVYGRLSDFVKDPHLRQALSFHTLLVGGDPFKTSSIYALIHALERKWGVWFPRGGTGALVAALAKLFTDIGGELRVNSPVDSITASKGRATGIILKSGEKLSYDAVASNADIVNTYDQLLSGHARGRSMGRRLKSKRFSNSLFVAYFGLSRKHDHLAHHSILFGPRYRELIADIFKGPNLPEDFSLYLHMPTKTDPTLAPDGCSAFYVLSPVPNLHKADIDWDAEGPLYRDRIFAYLESRYLPGLREDLMTSRVFTPADFQRELHAYAGSAFSIEPVLTQSAYFRVHNRDDAISNLYFVGAGTHPGAGIPGVVGSAKATAGLMLGDLLETTAHSQ
jgi:phytoene desaturase